MLIESHKQLTPSVQKLFTIYRDLCSTVRKALAFLLNFIDACNYSNTNQTDKHQLKAEMFITYKL